MKITKEKLKNGIDFCPTCNADLPPNHKLIIKNIIKILKKNVRKK